VDAKPRREQAVEFIESREPERQSAIVDVSGKIFCRDFDLKSLFSSVGWRVLPATIVYCGSVLKR